MKNGPTPIRWRAKADEQRLILFLGDLGVALISLFVALYLWGAGDQWLHFSMTFIKYRPQAWFWFLPVIWLLLLVELYDTHRSKNRKETLRGIGVSILISTALYLVLYFLLNSSTYLLPRRAVGYFIIAASILTVAWRLLYISIFTAPQFMRRVLIVGAGKAGCTLLKVIKETWPPPFYLVGLIDDDPNKIGAEIMGYPVLGGNDCLCKVIEEEGISDLVLAISGEMSISMFSAILDAQEIGATITTMPVTYEELRDRVPIFLLEADWIIRSFVDQAYANAFYELAKRLIDIVGGLVGLVGLAVLFPFIALSIFMDTGNPIIFYQNRLGKSAKPYKIIKFRTMVKDAEKDGQARATLEHDERITRVGWVLRKTHIDELPQFINVLRGEMSLVGPRAERSELVQELQSKIPFYRARLLIKPGITGWAQINFGYAATVDDTAIKLEYDLYYIKHRNLTMDFTILLRTFPTIVGFRGQ
jgi:exopolysaccharide biosynthesis polyprenyl glycosylphosphotransferase